MNSAPDPELYRSADTRALRVAFSDWLGRGLAVQPEEVETGPFGSRVAALRRLQALLYEAGWSRIGWPREIGGLGGSAIHRAAMYDELAKAGYPSRIVFEHLEILAPAIADHWDDALALHLPALLRGDDVWCQGFSEPDAGSDLVSLRTRAVRDGEGYRLSGRKIWTSWATVADRCVVLARTGTPEQRHLGLSVFLVDLRSEGIEVRAIRQGNGVDELAEVTFDDVWVPADRLVGAEGSGWQITLDVLSCERSAFAWLRHNRLYAHAQQLAEIGDDGDAEAMGEVLVDLFAVRCASSRAVRDLAESRFMGPAAAPVKVLLSDAEQHLYDLARRVLGPDLALGGSAGSTSGSLARWQEDFLFSRAVTVYGGSRQIQLTTIARFLLGVGG